MTNDHYSTLGLDPKASPADVKRAFRHLARKYHPDRNADRPEWAHDMMQRIIEANKVLANPSLRNVYDRKYRAAVQVRATAEAARRYRENATRATRAEMILDLLLDGRAREAVAMYEETQAKETGFDLKKHLASRDWIDCKFLIAEEYERQRRYDKALELYERLYGREETRSRHANFLGELRERLRKLYCRRLAPAAPPEQAVHYLIRALGLGLGRTENAFIHKKLAESYLALENAAEARRHLSIAFTLKPDLKGAAKICQKLGYAPGAVA